MNISSIVVQTTPKYLDQVVEALVACKEELEEHMEVLENADLVPKMLNDENVDPKKILYRGDLKKKDLEGFAKDFSKVD